VAKKKSKASAKTPPRRLVTPVPAVSSNLALRMTFSYEGDQISLVSQQPVEMILPPSHSLAEHEGQTGFWFTVHDAKNRALYRRVIQNPIRHDVEVFAPEGETTVHRQPVQKPKGTFTLLVPDIEGAQSVSISAPPLKPGAMHLGAGEIARFKIAKEKRP
jgi:hypothetical protein